MTRKIPDFSSSDALQESDSALTALELPPLDTTPSPAPIGTTPSPAPETAGTPDSRASSALLAAGSFAAAVAASLAMLL